MTEIMTSRSKCIWQVFTNSVAYSYSLDDD